MSLPNPFIDEMCGYLRDNSSGRFNYGSGDSKLVIGEILTGRNGVFVVQDPSDEPDRYTDVEYYDASFWAVNSSSSEALNDLRAIYQVFQQMHSKTFTSWYVYFSHVSGNIEDMDRDAENRKVYRLSVRFIIRSLIS